MHIRRPHAESSRRAQAIYVNDSSRGCRRRVRLYFRHFANALRDIQVTYSRKLFLSFSLRPDSRIFFSIRRRQVNASVLTGASRRFRFPPRVFSFSALYLFFCLSDGYEKERRRIVAQVKPLYRSDNFILREMCTRRVLFLSI